MHEFYTIKTKSCLSNTFICLFESLVKAFVFLDSGFMSLMDYMITALEEQRAIQLRLTTFKRIKEIRCPFQMYFFD